MNRPALHDDTSPAGSTAAIETVRVELGSRAYPVRVGRGLIADAGTAVVEALGGSATKAAIVTERNVAAHYLEPLTASLSATGLATPSLVLEPGEQTKSFAVLEQVCAWLLDAGVERSDCVVALGGGVIGDLAGFAASILRRGVALVQVPTSLLAQVDSSVGGKTAIDVPQGKNLIGSFFQPRLVLADIDTLGSLPARELRAGYAEVVKYGLIDRPAFFDWLEATGAALLSGDPAARLRAVADCVAAKAEIVAADERESGRRALLNLGHTFAHALEAALGYSEALKHGEAVAIGLVMAFDFSRRLGLCAEAEVARVRDHLAGAGLPIAPNDVEGAAFATPALLDYIAQDKKARGGRINLVLARSIGETFIAEDVDRKELAAFLDEVLT